MDLLGTDKAVGFMRGLKNYFVTFIECCPCAINLSFLFSPSSYAVQSCGVFRLKNTADV